MINVIREPMAANDLATVFARHPRIALMPSLGDPAWRQATRGALAGQWVKTIRDKAISLLDQPLAPLPPELYADFFATGRRVSFENVYFERRRHLAATVMATVLESDPAMQRRLLDSALAKVRDIFAEESWSLPAHVRESPTGKDPMTIDLFAAETANLFGELMALLGPALPADFVRDIRRRLQREIFVNYLDHPPRWEHLTMNWNAVCHQGVMGAALAVCDDPAMLGRLFERAARGLASFLSGFTADGGSTEGAGYWGYGFGWFAELNAQLEARTEGELSLFEGDPHVRAIATFGPKMMLSNGLSVNFSDNSPLGSPNPELLQYLSGRLGDEFIGSCAAIAWRQARDMNLDAQRADVFHLTRRFLRSPEILPDEVNLPATDIYLSALSVMVSRFRDDRDRLWEFAAKGGNNDEHHNHNDVGSYLLNIDGHRVLTEMGAPEYNKDFFSSKRYESIAARSLGHPVPLINGHEQPAGAEFAAKVIQQGFSENEVRFKLDLTAAYSAEAGCRFCQRDFHLDKRKGLLKIVDSFELEAIDSIETAVISESPVQLRDGQADIECDGITLRITPTDQTAIAEVQSLPFNARSGKASHISRIVLKPKSVQARVAIGFTAQLP